MSTDLTPERRAEIEAHRRIVEDCLSIPDADDPDGIVDRIMIRDVDDLLSAYDGMTRERDLLAETARRLTAERDRLQAALETFGDHDGGCDEFWENGASCSCGFARALNGGRAAADEPRSDASVRRDFIDHVLESAKRGTPLDWQDLESWAIAPGHRTTRTPEATHG